MTTTDRRNIQPVLEQISSDIQRATRPAPIASSYEQAKTRCRELLAAGLKDEARFVAEQARAMKEEGR